MIQKRRNVWASLASQPDRISGLVVWLDAAERSAFIPAIPAIGQKFTLQLAIDQN